MGRWHEVYLRDQRARITPASVCAQRATELFLRHGKNLILDLGCGTGRDTAYFLQAGLHVIGTDIEPAGVEVAQRRITEKGHSAAFCLADARILPFGNAAFEGVYSFGLLHEFTSMERDVEIQKVMREIYRILQPEGLLVLAVLSGDFRFGLPDVYLFNGPMFREATKDFTAIEIDEHDDIGCTGKTNYRVWYGAFIKKGVCA